MAYFIWRPDALVLEDGSYTMLDLNVLEDVAPGDGPKSVASKDVEREPSALATEAVQAPPKPTTALALPTTYASPFEGLVARPLEPVGAPSHFFVPAFAQHVVSTLVASLQTSTDISGMVRLINVAFLCLGIFNVDLRALHDRLYNLLHFRRELLIAETTFKKMTFGEGASTKFQAIVDQIDELQSLSCQVIEDFSDTSERVDETRYKVSMVKLLLSSLAKEFTNLEMELIVLGDVHSNIEQDLEQLSSQKDVILEEAAQVLLLGIKMRQARKAIKELEEEFQGTLSERTFLPLFF